MKVVIFIPEAVINHGIDEFSISGPSYYWEIESGVIQEHRLNPPDLGLQTVDYDDLPGGDASENYKIFFRLLDGEDCNGLLDMLCLNVAAGIYLLDGAPDLPSGLEIARETIISGNAKNFFDSYVKNMAKNASPSMSSLSAVFRCPLAARTA